MKGSRKIIITLSSIAFLVVVAIILNVIAENKLKSALDSALEKAGGSYEELDVNLLGRSVEVKQVKLKLSGKNVEVASVQLDDIGIIDYLRTGKIKIGKLLIQDPRLLIDNDKKDTTASKPSEKNSAFKETIQIDKLKLTNGVARIIQQDSTDKLYTRFGSIELQEVKIDSTTVKSAIPFKFEQYEFQNDSLYFQLNDLHTLTAKSINAENGHFEVDALKMLPVYSKTEHQQHIPYEKDRYNLTISNIELKDLNYTFKNDTLHLLNPYMQIKDPSLKIYRDKSKPDDPRQKFLYSQTLRNLPVKIKFDSIELKNGYILYEERTRSSRPPGSLDFSDLDATIYNLTNIGMEEPDFPKTQIDAQANFFEVAPLKVHWEFDISNLQDRFQISGNLGTLESAQINEFLQPTMNVKASGIIEDMQFNFYGNDDSGSGDMQLSYENFKVEVLEEDGTEEKGFLSAIANLVINNSTSEDKNIKDVQIERNKKKSFWNFLWMFIREGTIETLL